MPDGIQEGAPTSPADTIPQRVLRLGRYAHFKGRFYVVVGVGRRDSDSDAQLVVYVSEADMQVWVRPLANFNECLDRETYRGPRFLKVPESTVSRRFLEALHCCVVCDWPVSSSELEWNESGTKALHRGECVRLYVEKALGSLS